MYELDNAGNVIRVSDRTYISKDPASRARVEYDAWLAEGGVPPYVPPDLPPASFTPPQIIGALKSWGVADAVINATSKVDLAEFYTATAILETESRLTAMLTSIGKTVDDLKAHTTSS